MQIESKQIMNRLFLLIILIVQSSWCQSGYHVFPAENPKTPGTPSGDGSLEHPWDLQTALNSKKLKGGDVIWLHAGVYNGRFSSSINGETYKKIIVAARPYERVVLNGNINSKQSAVLNIRSSNVVFRDFEISPYQLKTRNEDHPDFVKFAGIDHLSGTNCEFINLSIHGNNGLGIGSWNTTGGTKIINCLIYDNGFIRRNGRGAGEGIYVQNSSETETRLIGGNIIFANYYKGIEVWSASRDANREWVKNILVIDNVLFNNGLPAKNPVDNIIVGTDDRNGVNIAKNIKIENNILYHNTDFQTNQANGDAPCLTLGFHINAPIENVSVKNNILLGRNNVLRILYAKSLMFNNNKVYGGYLHIGADNLDKKYFNYWQLVENKYFTKNGTPFYVPKRNKLGFKDWQKTYGLDRKSEWMLNRDFDLPDILQVIRYDDQPNVYRLTLFSKDGSTVKVSPKLFKVKDHKSFEVFDVEKSDKPILSGSFSKAESIMIPMEHSSDPNKTLNNFGVFLVKFKN